MSSARHSRPGKRSRSRRLTAIKKNKLGEPTAIARLEETEEAAFVEYYQAQELLEEEEWPRFMAMLKRPLPVTFRFNRNCSDKTILTSLEGCIAGEYMPELDAWQLSEGAHALKAADTPEDRRLRKWLADASSVGVVTRQEVVSMLPVAFLGIEPHHHVLDMCASPGSKTTQAIDALNASSDVSGFVVANDVEPHRAYILVRRCSALPSSCSRLLVAQHKAQKFPAVAHEGRQGSYDRIICDVPCCGDGTLRKSPDMWRRWHPGFAIGLHKLQLQIAMRGLALLRVGGIMAYSTCTFNPIEDEAVVAALLRSYEGHIELVDASELLPSVVRRKGIKTWTVFDDEMKSYSKWEDIGANSMGIVKTMFPPSDQERRQLKLHRCMRFYPHDQDTGGFFITLIRKKAPLVSPADEFGRLRKEHALARPHFCLTAAADSAAWAFLKQRFELSPTADTALLPHLFVRSPTRAGSIYYLDSSLKKHILDAPGSEHLRLVSAGKKMTYAHGRSVPFALTEAGARALHPHASSQVLEAKPRHVAMLLHNVRNWLVVAEWKRARKLTPGPIIIHHVLESGQEVCLPGFFKAADMSGVGPYVKLAPHFTPGLELRPRALTQALLAAM